MDKKSILKAFEEHLSKSTRRNYYDYYIGITDDIEGFLFEKHKIPKEGHWYIYALADSYEEALEIKNHYMAMNMRGNYEDYDRGEPHYIYCYEVTQNTVEL